jgi:hypothetical protein
MAVSPTMRGCFAGLRATSSGPPPPAYSPTSRRRCSTPVIPTFLTQTLQATGSIVGLLDGAAQATQNIVQGFSAALSDKLQRRKAIAPVG